MSKLEKALIKMSNNPRDWKIEELMLIANRFGVTYRQPGTSHVTFRAATGKKVTIPAHRPIKPVYVKLFVALIEGLGGSDE